VTTRSSLVRGRDATTSQPPDFSFAHTTRSGASGQLTARMSPPAGPAGRMAVTASRRVYPVVFIDALMVKIRDGVIANRPVYLAIGIDCDGAKQVLGLWVGPTHRRVQQVLAHRALRAQVSRRGRCMHRLLRRAHRTTRCDQCHLAGRDRAAVRGAPDPRLAALRVQAGLDATGPNGPPLEELIRSSKTRRSSTEPLINAWHDTRVHDVVTHTERAKVGSRRHRT
jgi:hypothetical protein